MEISAKLITIEWEGPLTLNDVAHKCNNSRDYGLYQIYGTHNIFGPNSLLYIGKAEEQTFSARIPAHTEWITWEPGSIEVYLGRLGGTEPMTEERHKEWCSDIDTAERLLIFFSSPPYNSQNIKQYGGDIKNVVVINYKKRHRLPIEVSTLYEEIANESRWKVYE